MVVPRLKVWVPRTLIPVAAELPVVTPVITHVRVVTEQLSLYVGSATAMDFVHPETRFWLILAGQLSVGLILSLIVTVKEHVAVLLAASFAV